MRHDEAFKLLLSAVPGDILCAFADDVARAWGDPGQVLVETVEVLPRVKGLRRSRFFDLAVHLRWPTGQRAILLLTEHFSHGKDVDLPRVALYTTALMQRHPGIPVLPVVIVGQGGAHITPALTSQIAGEVILDFRCRLLALDRDLLERWQRTHSPILAVLAALLRDQPGPQSAYRASCMVRASHDGLRLLALVLPLIQHLANLTSTSTPEFHHLLAEDEHMISIIDLIESKGLAKGLARGKAEGKAEGKADLALALLRRQLASGRLTIDGARAEVEAMRQAGELTDAIAAHVLTALG